MNTVAPDETPNPAAEQVIRRVKLMMAISGGITLLLLAGILGVIGYRLYNTGSVAPSGPPATSFDLPAGARIVSTAATDDRIVVTVDIGGRLQILTFDAHTLKPTGRLDFGR